MMLVNPYLFGGGIGVTAPKWDAASIAGNSGATFTLTESGAVATASGASSFATLLGEAGHSSGKRYFEIVVLALPGSAYNWYGGLSTAPVVADQFSSSTNLRAYLRAGGQMWTQAVIGGATATVSSVSIGTVVGVAVDFDARTAEFLANNASFYTYVWTGSPTFFPSLGSTASGVAARLSGASSDLAYSPPTGFSPWV